ncbi:RDD domain containing protein [Segniliparus rotundus DSM 44985]|uniref:RDD domain containing protein n=1 Tax=Segniliparus rotundus (strain ATCC BAA-972 / CDC 1076 / CIP 108378 / DSM 44985 / JCM 13578) TaxID=640132 RepID=D6Z928_SEGRD|nr:RDD family protein [Segniliparus rotundus]ADG98458.1 RDD domain containing protein [Segniliparus rotundus DSM 44985]
MPELVTGDAVVLDVQLAQLPVRALAKLIDAALQLAVLVLVLFVACFGAVAAAAYHRMDGAWVFAMFLFLAVMIVVGYPVLAETLTRGRTVGKMAMGLRVVAEDGGPVRFRQALVRGLMAVFEIYSLGAAPAVISSLVSAKGKRIGDMFAGTVVINERAERVPPPLPMPVGLAPWARSLSLAKLSPELALLAQQYVRRARELRPQVSQALERRIADEVAASVSPPPPSDMPASVLIVTVLAERSRREWQRYAREAARRDALRERRERAHSVLGAG